MNAKNVISTSDIRTAMLLQDGRQRHRLTKAIVVAFFAVLILAQSTCTTVKSHAIWLDPVTASVREQYQWHLWRFKIDGQPQIERSALDTWLRERGEPDIDNWQFVGRSYQNIWGSTGSHASGRAPACYSIQGEMMAIFVANASDEQILKYVDAMRNGNEDEQWAAVKEAGEIILTSLESSQESHGPK